MNSRSDPTPTANIPMPRLSDDAVVQIHDFLHHVLDLFEACYSDQIDRFYDGLCEDCIEFDTAHDSADPTF